MAKLEALSVFTDWSDDQDKVVFSTCIELHFRQYNKIYTYPKKG